ncbi:MAG: glutamate formimidoyltransferase [Bacteroidales bacterium]|nr:glutamate formimidoyltransferase [Bacteroidales bacterium]
MRIIECVPNFSEGRDRNVIDKIAAVIKDGGVKLLNVDPGEATNRTVYTYVGEPEKVISATFNAIKAAQQLIDMRVQHGTHPRIGAADVVPLVPVSEVTLDECAAYARRLSRMVGEDLGIPVYCYESAAFTPERQNLAHCRDGEYEGIKAKIADKNWKPDFGPTVYNETVARSGISVIGARDYLIAINYNLNTSDVAVAKEIAGEVRESGHKIKENGITKRVPGLLKGCKAIGWYIDEYKVAQVSMNVTNISETPVHIAYKKVCEQAEKHGVKVTGCELIGLVPKKVMTAAGEYFFYNDTAAVESAARNKKQPTEKELIQMAIKGFNLNDVKPFDPSKNIIENLL